MDFSWLEGVNWWPVIGVMVGAHMMKKIMIGKAQKKVEHPTTTEEYVTKLCLILQKDVFQVFEIAAEEKSPWKMSRERINQDVKRFIKEKYIPAYVENFIEEGKEIIAEAEVFEYH